MIEAAIAGSPAFVVSRYEVDRGGVNYSVDTLEHLHQEYPDAKLFFLMGADMLMDLPNWHEAPRVCTLATPIVARRAGAVPPRFFDSCIRLAPAERIEQIRAQPGGNARDRHQQLRNPSPRRRRPEHPLLDPPAVEQIHLYTWNVSAAGGCARKKRKAVSRTLRRSPDRATWPTKVSQAAGETRAQWGCRSPARLAVEHPRRTRSQGCPGHGLHPQGSNTFQLLQGTGGHIQKRNLCPLIWQRPAARSAHPLLADGIAGCGPTRWPVPKIDRVHRGLCSSGDSYRGHVTGTDWD